jgi:hypothetical protein
MAIRIERLNADRSSCSTFNSRRIARKASAITTAATDESLKLIKTLAIAATAEAQSSKVLNSTSHY